MAANVQKSAGNTVFCAGYNDRYACQVVGKIVAGVADLCASTDAKRPFAKQVFLLFCRLFWADVFADRLLVGRWSYRCGPGFEIMQQALQQAMSGKRVLLCLDVSMWLCLDVTLPGCDFPCV